MEKNLPQSARKTRLHARSWQACPLCAEVTRTPCAHFGRKLGTSKKFKDGGLQACFSFLLVSKVCSVYLYVRANYFFERKVLNCIYFIFTRYEIRRNAVSCFLSWSRLEPHHVSRNVTLPTWFLVSYNYFHRFLNILFFVNFDFFLLEPIVRFIYSCLFCFLWLGLGGGGYCHLYGLYGYVLLWGIWMGKWSRRVMQVCKLSQIPIQCQCGLITGLFFPLSLITRVWTGGGGTLGISGWGCRWDPGTLNLYQS